MDQTLDSSPRKLSSFGWFAAGPDAPPITDRADVDQKYRRLRISVLTAITCGYGLLYTCRLGFNIAKVELLKDGIFDANQLGKIGSSLFFGYAIGKLFNGFIADYVNVRKFMAVGILMSALINLAMGLAPIFSLWLILWGLNGWFQGTGAPSSGVTLANWFSNKERGRFYGIWSASHSIGEGLTNLGTPLLVSWILIYSPANAWRGGFIGPGIVCCLTALGVFTFLRDRPQTLGLPAIADYKNDHAAPTKPEDDKGTIWSQLKIFSRPSLWVLCVASGMMYITRYGIISWGTVYLVDVRGYSLLAGSALLLVNTVSGLAGCVVYGYVSDYFFHSRRPPVTLIYGILEILSLLGWFYIPPGHPILLFTSIALFGFTMSGLLAVIGGLFAIDIASKKVTGAVMGFVGAISYIFAAFQEQITGKLIHAGTTTGLDGVKHYDFSKPILFWIGASIASMLLAASLWNVKPKD